MPRARLSLLVCDARTVEPLALTFCFDSAGVLWALFFSYEPDVQAATSTKPPGFDICIGPGQRVGTARRSQFEDALALWGHGVLLQRDFLGVPAFVPGVGAPLPAADMRPRSRHVKRSCVVCCQWG